MTALELKVLNKRYLTTTMDTKFLRSLIFPLPPNEVRENLCLHYMPFWFSIQEHIFIARLLENFHRICCTKGAEWFDRVIQFPAGVFSHHCSNNNLSSFLCQTTVLKSILVKLSLEFLHDTHGNQQLKGNIYRYLNGISAHYIQSPI